MPRYFNELINHRSVIRFLPSSHFGHFQSKSGNYSHVHSYNCTACSTLGHWNVTETPPILHSTFFYNLADLLVVVVVVWMVCGNMQFCFERTREQTTDALWTLFAGRWHPRGTIKVLRIFKGECVCGEGRVAGVFLNVCYLSGCWQTSTTRYPIAEWHSISIVFNSVARHFNPLNGQTPFFCLFLCLRSLFRVESANGFPHSINCPVYKST